MNSENLLQKVLGWKVRLSPRNFFLILSVVVGTLAGLAAVALKLTTHYLEVLLHVFEPGENYKLLIYPVVGIILATTYTQFFQKGKLGRGISNVVENIYKKSSFMEKDKMYSHMITSSLTIGFGGSMGLEAPIVVTGSALGSNVARYFNLEYKDRTLLLACGAAAGISAVFSAPIAGVLFAIEVLLGEFSTVNFVPLLISSAVASVIAQVTPGEHGQIFYIFTQGWDVRALPFYVVLSVITGFYSLYIMKGITYSENLLKRFTKPYPKAIIGGAVLGLMIFLLPPLYGEGYHTVQMLLNTEYTRLFEGSILYKLHDSTFALILFTLAILVIKVIASQLTISSGGNGGFFAPSLFMGAVLGFFYVYVIKLLGFNFLNQPNFIAVAMAGVMAGVMHTPLTAIFLIAEVTGGYYLLVPLMIVSSLSFLISKYLNPHSIYVKH
jgi:chloride channel protein, CIC family